MTVVLVVLLLLFDVAIAAVAYWKLIRPRRQKATAWRRAHELFSRVVELEGEDRETVLDRAAAGDATLRDAVASLLRAHDKTGPLDRLERRIKSDEGDQDETTEAPRQQRVEADVPADLVAGHYRLIDRLGAGGMGEVYRAHDTQLGRDIAIKFLSSQHLTTASTRERFIREARSAAKLDHPNICTVHEIGETEDGRLYIAMALYDGETLADRIARGPLEWNEAVNISCQVARGLARAHAAGIVHRDIKPANICITAEGVVKIVDFGIAKMSDTTLADGSALLGTVAYMSPEQVNGELVDQRTDLWSLGVVIHEMLTGRRVFKDDFWPALMAAIRAAEPVPLGRLRGTAPLSVLRVVRRLLERDPANRIGSAAGLEQRLREAATHTDDTEQSQDGAVAPRLAADGEHRQVTVLVGTLSAWEPTADESAVGNGRSNLEAAVREVIESHGGLMHDWDGSQLVALFGIPITREDDQLRAVRASHDLHELLALGGSGGDASDPMLTIGIASGTTDVIPQSGRPGHYRLGGEIIAAAVSACGEIVPGQVAVHSPSRKLLSVDFTIEPIGPTARDAADSLPTLALVTPHRTDSVAEDLAWSSRLTAYSGRTRELETLTAALKTVCSGTGQVVTITGEAGTGKSRLLHEFRSHIEGDSALLVVGHCESFSGSKSYQPFIAAIQGVLGITPASEAGPSVTDISTAIEEIDPLLAQFAPQLLHLLAVDSPTDEAPVDTTSGHAIRDAIAAFFTMAANQAPLVIFLEDWHWRDDASAEVLNHLVSVGASYPLLMVVTQRPDSGSAWDGSGVGPTIRLMPLSLDESNRMVVDLLGGAIVPEDVGSAIHERTGGNPFYLEELARTLQEAGMLKVVDARATLSRDQDRLHLPGTIQGVVRSRLDRLEPEVREVVRSAAVLGREFSLKTLEEMGLGRYELTMVLQRLAALGLVRQVRVVPERLFRFSHAYIHEVAYDTLLPHQRVALHRKAAQALVAIHGDHDEEYAARIAWQYQGSEEWVEAARQGLLAARRSRQLLDYREALRTLTDATEWLSRAGSGSEHDELMVQILLAQEEVCEPLGLQQQQGEIIEQLLVHPAVMNDSARLADVLRRKGDRLTLRREFDAARKALGEALVLVRERGDQAAEGVVLRSLGLVGWQDDRLEEALTWLDQAITLEKRRGDDRALSLSMTSHGQVLKNLGRLSEAMVSLEAAIEVASKAGFTGRTLMGTLCFNAWELATQMGDAERVDRLRPLLEQLGTQSKNSNYDSYLLVAEARASLAAGDIADAITKTEHSIVLAREIGFADGLARSLQSLGLLLASSGRESEAIDKFVEAAEALHQLGRTEVEYQAWLQAARLAERIRVSDRASNCWSRCRDLAVKLGDAEGEIQARLGLARTARFDGPQAANEARTELNAALEVSQRLGLTAEAARVHNTLGISDWEGGNHRDALEHFETALELFTALADLPHVAQMHNAVARTLRSLGEPDVAKTHLAAGIEAARRADDPRNEGLALAVLGDIELDAGSLEDARVHYRESLAIRRATGDRRGEGWMNHALAEAARRCGETQAMEHHLEQARALGEEVADGELSRACKVLEDQLQTSKES